MRKLKALIHDSSGVTVVEFALISPVLLILLMGTYDAAYQLYASSVLQGAIQKAGRDSTIEGAAASIATIDQKVADTVRYVVPNATIAFTRKSYTNFGNVATPEDFTDQNNNGTCDFGEVYEDANGNGTWDADRGKDGQGGSKDAVLYTVTVTYPRPLAIAPMIGLSKTITLKTETVLRNQPYGLQGVTKLVKNCS